MSSSGRGTRRGQAGEPIERSRPSQPLTPDGERLIELEARVEALEAALLHRSRELRALQRLLGERELAAVARIASGHLVSELEDAINPFELEAWRERSTLESAEVPETLANLWRVVTRDARDGRHGTDR